MNNPDSGSIEQFAEIFARLAAPFRNTKRRPGRNNQEYEYIDSTMVMNRLDDAVGPGRWNDSYQVIDNCVYCQITIYLPDGSKVTRGDASGYDVRKEGEKSDRLNSNVIKSAFSDSFKRAALKFGVGRYIKSKGAMPLYYKRIADRVRKEVPAEPAPATTRPDPAQPPGPEEFPQRQRREQHVARPGAVLFRVLTNPPYADQERSYVNRANYFGSNQDPAFPERIVDWKPEQIMQFWAEYFDEPMPRALAELMPHPAHS